MDRTFAKAVIVSIWITATLGAVLVAQRAAAPARTSASDTSAQIAAAAQAVLASLDEAGRAKVQFPAGSSQKTKWSNLPSPMYQRFGIRLGDLTASQRAAVMKLLTVALSAEGYRKVQEIMEGDEVLRKNPAASAPPAGARGPGGPPGGGRGPGGPPGGGGGPAFGADNYYLSFVGTPSATTPWLLQYGGHHLAINLTIGGAQATMAPSLPAAQPANFTVEGRTVRPLGDENDKAFALINALDARQKSQAIIGSRVVDLVLGPGADGKTIQPEGIRGSALSAPQQAMLWDIVHEWVGISADAYAEPRMAEIKSHLNDTYFAWSGPTTNGSAAYFRIQGPTLVIEYSPQGSVDHIHTIYRDPTNDYGAQFTK